MSITIHKSYNSNSKLEKCGIYVAKLWEWKEFSLIIISNIYNDTNYFYLGVPIKSESEIVNRHLSRYVKLPNLDGNYNHFQINIKDLYPISQIKEYVPYVVNDKFFKIKNKVLTEWWVAANFIIYHGNIIPKTINLGNVYIAKIINMKRPTLIIICQLKHNHKTKTNNGYFFCAKKVKSHIYNKNKKILYDLKIENETDYLLRVNCQFLYSLDNIKSIQPYFVKLKPLSITKEILLDLYNYSKN